MSHTDHQITIGSKREREMMLHVFIQWLAHHELLNDWLDEICAENLRAGYTIERRAKRLTNSLSTRGFLKSSFGFSRSKKGPAFWNACSTSWTQQVMDIELYLKGE